MKIYLKIQNKSFARADTSPNQEDAENRLGGWAIRTEASKFLWSSYFTIGGKEMLRSRFYTSDEDVNEVESWFRSQLEAREMRHSIQDPATKKTRRSAL